MKMLNKKLPVDAGMIGLINEATLAKYGRKDDKNSAFPHNFITLKKRSTVTVQVNAYERETKVEHLEAGTYYVGDPCYIINAWDKFLNETNFGQEAKGCMVLDGFGGDGLHMVTVEAVEDFEAAPAPQGTSAINREGEKSLRATVQHDNNYDANTLMLVASSEIKDLRAKLSAYVDGNKRQHKRAGEAQARVAVLEGQLKAEQDRVDELNAQRSKAGQAVALAKANERAEAAEAKLAALTASLKALV